MSRREFWDLLTNVHIDGVTIVVCTPYLDEAERCTHVALMHRGALIANDTPNALRANLGAFVFEGHSTQARKAEHMIQTHAGVLNTNTYGDVLRVIVDDPARMVALQTEWQTRGLDVPKLERVNPRLEDVFVLAIGTGDERRMTKESAPA